MNETTIKSGMLELLDRKTLTINGVEDIFAFDDHSVYLKTAVGELSVEGEELRLCDLSLQNGILSVSGRIDGLYYVDQREKKKRGLFGRKN